MLKPKLTIFSRLNALPLDLSPDEIVAHINTLNWLWLKDYNEDLANALHEKEVVVASCNRINPKHGCTDLIAGMKGMWMFYKQDWPVTEQSKYGFCLYEEWLRNPQYPNGDPYEHISYA